MREALSGRGWKRMKPTQPMQVKQVGQCKVTVKRAGRRETHLPHGRMSMWIGACTASGACRTAQLSAQGCEQRAPREVTWGGRVGVRRRFGFRRLVPAVHGGL